MFQIPSIHLYRILSNNSYIELLSLIISEGSDFLYTLNITILIY